VKKDAATSSEVLLPVYKISRRYILKDNFYTSYRLWFRAFILKCDIYFYIVIQYYHVQVSLNSVYFREPLWLKAKANFTHAI
jgi:hypothetical protein